MKHKKIRIINFVDEIDRNMEDTLRQREDERVNEPLYRLHREKNRGQGIILELWPQAINSI